MDHEKIEDSFSAGVDAYWCGDVPDGWDAPDAWKNPYLAGWLIASHQDNGIEFFADDGEDEDDGDFEYEFRVVIETMSEQYEYEVMATSQDEAESDALVLAWRDGLPKSESHKVTYRTTRLD